MNPLIRWIKRLEARLTPPVLAISAGASITLTTKQLRDGVVVLVSGGSSATTIAVPATGDTLSGSALTVINTSTGTVTAGGVAVPTLQSLERVFGTAWATKRLSLITIPAA